MTKFIQREKEIVDAYQFIGGKKESMALAKLISNHGGADATWRPVDRTNQKEHISVVTDAYGDLIFIGDWVIISEDNSVEHLTDDQFNDKYEKVKFPRVALIWKDIPGFPNWQVSNSGLVRNVGYPGYKRRTKDGDFILRRNGKTERWSEYQLGNNVQIKEFFAN